ncbi:DNA-directed RNA polymerase subunit beta', partial [Candidatus Falkowbacteria bacterium]|nr:DNA-directed RNA polymerase subunit beta' [Candidatus Falkowbacteria bacterium]
KGKQGRFRQNLLGKRVDYSGRSVIIVGPHLKLHQVGLPKVMAIELFKPFVISRLIKAGHVHNVRSASRLIEQGPKEVWDILEEVIKESTVMINRAPTLHRLSIQSFKPILIEGKAIQIHPLVCPPFNADFDGDQMAVHVPLTEEAKKESANLMLSINNLLKPATGDPVTTPDKDMIWGCYFMTRLEDTPPEKIKAFSSEKEAVIAYENKCITTNQKIKVKTEGKLKENSVGRILFNSILPKELRDYEQVMGLKTMKKIISTSLDLFGPQKTAVVLDAIKDLTFEYMTAAGASWGMDDLPNLPEREDIIKETEGKVAEIEEQFEAGFLTEEERHVKIIELWVAAKDKIVELSQASLDKNGSVYSMVESGARGSWGQITQMMGMKGLVTNPQGEIIELPIKANYKKGFNVLEYFIATHGSRKGLADTALRTANAGYLTRRLVDVSHDVVITEENCGDKEGIVLTRRESEEMGEELEDRIIGRVLIEDIVDPKGKVVVKKGEIVSKSKIEQITKLALKEIRIRSVINCRTIRGACQKCYGYDLGYNKPVKLGTAVGIIAAQSIGEPGTQLTLKTFHTGGVAGKDITQGLPRVEEIFEARPLKRKAVVAEVSGSAKIAEGEDGRKIQIKYKENKEDRYQIKNGYTIIVKDGDSVIEGEVLMERGKIAVGAKNPGTVKITENQIKVVVARDNIKEYPVMSNDNIWISNGDLVAAGDQLTDGNVDLFELYQLKGRTDVQKYIIKEIQYIYSSQGQKLNDKHIEVIARQMFSRCLIVDSGDTNLLPGETMSKIYVNKVNEEILAAKKKPAKAKELLLGITKVSLSVDSFLSAASFQETARVLIDASTNGRIDHLLGLKENVIIGRLIPAGTGFVQEGGKLPNASYLNSETK